MTPLDRDRETYKCYILNYYIYFFLKMSMYLCVYIDTRDGLVFAENS